MVRETRFIFDDERDPALEPTPEDFTEEDDVFLDAFCSPTAKVRQPDAARHKRGIRKPPSSDPENIQSESSCDKRAHLSDADWLTNSQDKIQKRQRKLS